MSVRPLIEQWFPAETVGAESLRDGSAAKKPPVNRLHVWWARRPLTASRAAILGSMLPAWPAPAQAAMDADQANALAALQAEFGTEEKYHAWFLRALGILGDPVAGRKQIEAARVANIRLDGNGYGYQRAFTVTPAQETLEQLQRLASHTLQTSGRPTILDPFAGGGSIPFEATRFGLQTEANELNPVAIAILHGTVDLPARMGPDFARTLESAGQRWSTRVRERLEPFFPKQDGEVIIAYIWAHTVPCPSTGRPTPLAPNLWLSRGDGADAAVRLDVDREADTITPVIVTGAATKAAGARATYRNGVGECVWCDGETFDGEYIQNHAQAGRLGELMLAVCVTSHGRTGRRFRAPLAADIAAVEAARDDLRRSLPRWEVEDVVPNDEVPDGLKTPELLRMGRVRWRDAFTDRQLLTHLAASEELGKVLADLTDDWGARVGEALALYLSFAVSKALNYDARMSTWHPTRSSVANVFDRHDYAFKWTFGEFDGALGLYPWAIDGVIDAYDGLARLAQAKGGPPNPAAVRMGSATSLPNSDRSVDLIVTDPPYYNNVMYGELSDYFYVWLKRLLRQTWPELCALKLTNKRDEAVANPAPFRDLASPRGRGRRGGQGPTADQLADRRYEELLTASFGEAHRVLKDTGVMTVMFTHKRVDAWDTLGSALLNAGFTIGSSWPVHTEPENSLHQAKKNAASSTILLTCRKRGSTEPGWWDDIKPKVAAAVREAAVRFEVAGMRGVDLTLATFGPALAVLSQNWPVMKGELDPDTGKSMVLRPEEALDLARSEVARLKKRGLLGGRDVQFDPLSDFYLMAWNDFKARAFPAGEALKLAIATGLELDEVLRRRKLLSASSGTVEILKPSMRVHNRSVDPDASSQPSLVDYVQLLLHTFEVDGEPVARTLLGRFGLEDEERFRSYLQALVRALPGIRDKSGQLVVDEARTLENLRLSLFPWLDAPIEELRPEQLALAVAGEDTES